MFAIVVSWLLVILMVALFVTGLHERITVINWPLTVGYLFLPESSVMVENCTSPPIRKFKQCYTHIKGKANVGHKWVNRSVDCRLENDFSHLYSTGISDL